MRTEAGQVVQVEASSELGVAHEMWETSLVYRAHSTTMKKKNQQTFL